jgi:hypothetical protein
MPIGILSLVTRSNYLQISTLQLFMKGEVRLALNQLAKVKSSRFWIHDFLWLWPQSQLSSQILFFLFIGTTFSARWTEKG